MKVNPCISYSFSFQKNICQDIRYYRKTNPNSTLKQNIEAFILKFIKSTTPYELNHVSQGRPFKGKAIDPLDKYESFQFSLKKSTIKRIREYKKKENMPELDKNIEEYIKLVVPCRVVR